MPDRIEIRRLSPSDDRSGFHSGNPDLDRFFKRFAGQNQFRHHIGVSYVATGSGRILGYVTVAPSQIEIEDLPGTQTKRLPDYPLPVLRLARLAVDESARGQGVGKTLLRFALSLSRQMSREYGCIGVVVDAKPDATGFYRRLGFEPMISVEGALYDRPEPIPMFVPVSAIPVPV